MTSSVSGKVGNRKSCFDPQGRREPPDLDYDISRSRSSIPAKSGFLRGSNPHLHTVPNKQSNLIPSTQTQNTITAHTHQSFLENEDISQRCKKESLLGSPQSPAVWTGLTRSKDFHPQSHLKLTFGPPHMTSCQLTSKSALSICPFFCALN